MAELINLKEADKFMERFRSTTDYLDKSINDPNKGIWTDAQRAELKYWWNALADLHNTLKAVMNNNRDGARDAGRKAQAELDDGPDPLSCRR